jgi:hypothetical protein
LELRVRVEARNKVMRPTYFSTITLFETRIKHLLIDPVKVTIRVKDKVRVRVSVRVRVRVRFRVGVWVRVRLGLV